MFLGVGKKGEGDNEAACSDENSKSPGIGGGISSPNIRRELPGQLPQAAVRDRLVDRLECRLVAGHGDSRKENERRSTGRQEEQRPDFPAGTNSAGVDYHPTKSKFKTSSGLQLLEATDRKKDEKKV